MKNKTVNFIMKAIIILIVIIVCIFAGFIYTHAKKEETSTSDKVEEEIKYLDIKLTSLINALNGIQLENYKVTVTKVQEEESKSDSTEEKKSEEGTEESKKEEEEGTSSDKETEITKMERKQVVEEDIEINWKVMQEETEVLYSVWTSMVLDFYEVGIESDKIVNFSNTIDELIISIKEEEKTKIGQNIAKLYNLLPDFANKSSMEELSKSAINAKSNIMNAYASIETENWQKVAQEITNAETKFSQNIKNISQKEETKKYNINKTYILIEELKNSLDTKEKGIFYIKYKNLIEELNKLI